MKKHCTFFSEFLKIFIYLIMIEQYYNLDLENMTPEEIESLQRKFLVEELGKKLIDLDIHCSKTAPFVNGKRVPAYLYLAKLYWPEEFADNKRKHVHHIDFNRKHNTLSNLVVLTPKEHRTVHSLFDVKWDRAKEKISTTLKGHVPWNKGKKSSKLSTSLIGVWKDWHWNKDTKTGKRVWWRINSETGEIEYKKGKSIHRPAL